MESFAVSAGSQRKGGATRQRAAGVTDKHVAEDYDSKIRKKRRELAKFITENFWDLPDTYKFGQSRSVIVGLSCLAFLFPAYTLWSVDRPESVLWVVTAALSLVSDYFITGQRKQRWKRALHLLDRWVGAANFLFQFLRLPWFLMAGYRPFCVACCGVVGSFLCKQMSWGVHTFGEYVVWHSVWHFYASAMRGLVVLLDHM
ncbi:unnamed protein product [Vitrella brassicaformis CCMP3155]|uniref:Uncharacterized protein n=2 Tax=Vitrella brassicaformis TaxID=1169539 RepID=A0A0G4GRA7_VITBC|nr:unnamed protein product [Vitrella brassicaformis CCMP3155]|mmetsp:Transcript_49574/g.124299  ORF Transcript_49574/g.124299 Transcript_49574/m.124299 type:complete len:201 (+) Transcript_49574:306-908(+)|eukprot:CEM33070.1 unnamed protein product [Vitrella brassicaformis CCMP3155]